MVPLISHKVPRVSWYSGSCSVSSAPGGTGIAEGLFVVLFSAFVPNGTVGIIAVGWRVVAEYMPFFIGMYAVLTLYGRQFVAQETSREQ